MLPSVIGGPAAYRVRGQRRAAGDAAGPMTVRFYPNNRLNGRTWGECKVGPIGGIRRLFDYLIGAGVYEA